MKSIVTLNRKTSYILVVIYGRSECESTGFFFSRQWNVSCCYTLTLSPKFTKSQKELKKAHQSKQPKTNLGLYVRLS
jgi:hypothetical protein